MTAVLHKENLYHQLASLLHAGFPIDKAAESLLAQNPPAPRRSILEALKNGLGQGQSIAGSLSTAVSPLEASLLDAAEQGGRLGDGCEHLAQYFGLIRELRSMLLVRMLYPVALLHAAFLLPSLIQVIAGQGSLFKSLFIPLLMLWVVLGGIIFGIYLLLKAAETQPAIDRILRYVPILGGLRRSLAEARLAKVMEISLLSGRKTDQTFRLGAEASSSGLIRSAAESIVPQVAAGQPLGPFLRGVLERDMADGLEIAEKAGQLEVESGRFASLRQTQAKAKAQTLGFWLPAIIYGIAMIAVAMKIISLATGYFNTIKSIGDGVF